MPYKLLLFCSAILLSACNTSKKSINPTQAENLKAKIKEYISCLNSRDEACLQQLYSPEYQSLSPINKPENVKTFINQTIRNLEKNNFEVAIKIKELEVGVSQAYISMNWQLKTKGKPKEDDPFANVQRLDIWKKDARNNWRIFRTLIYNERAF